MSTTKLVLGKLGQTSILRSVVSEGSELKWGRNKLTTSPLPNLPWLQILPPRYFHWQREGVVRARFLFISNNLSHKKKRSYRASPLVKVRSCYLLQPHSLFTCLIKHVEGKAALPVLLVVFTWEIGRCQYLKNSTITALHWILKIHLDRSLLQQTVQQVRYLYLLLVSIFQVNDQYQKMK